MNCIQLPAHPPPPRTPSLPDQIMFAGRSLPLNHAYSSPLTCKVNPWFRPEPLVAFAPRRPSVSAETHCLKMQCTHSTSVLTGVTLVATCACPQARYHEARYRCVSRSARCGPKREAELFRQPSRRPQLRSQYGKLCARCVDAVWLF